MNCSLNTVLGLIATAVALLGVAIAMAVMWPYAWPLLIAAALVAIVSLVVIPALKNALAAYAACRGPSANCSISTAVNSLGQAASIISFISFAAAGALQIAALAAIASLIGSWLGVGLEAIVAGLVTSGIVACGATIILLLGVLTQALTFKSCMDQQPSGTGGPPSGPSASG